MTRTVTRYLIAEVLGPFVVALVILTFVLFMFQILKLTELIVSYGFELADVGRMLLYILPPFFVFTVPMSFLLAVLMAVSRLSSDSEITALKAGGFSLYQLLPPILVLSLVASAAASGLSLYADPWGKKNFHNLLLDLGRRKATVGITEHVFNESLKDLELYVHHLVPEQDLLEGVVLSDERDPAQSVIVTARTGRLLGKSAQGSSLALALTDGAIHRFDPKTPNAYEIARFSSGEIIVDLEKAVDEANPNIAYLEMGISELSTHIEKLRREGEEYHARRAWTEYHKRFAFPFVCIVFGLVALPLGVSPPRSGRSRGFATSVIVLCVFYLLFRAGENMGWRGVVHPAIAMWTPLLIGMVFGLYLLKKKADESNIWLIEVLQYGSRNLARRLARRLGFGADDQELP